MRNLIASLYNFLRYNRRLRLYYKLKKTQSNSIEEIQDNQYLKLKELLEFSYKNIPYYTELFDQCGLAHNGSVIFKDIQDLNKIPPLTKEIIRQQKDKLYYRYHNLRKSYFNTSGGSTGEPVLFVQDKNYMIHSMANFFLVKNWRNVSPFSHSTYLWGAVRDLNTNNVFKRKLSLFLNNVVFFNSSKMNAKTMVKFINYINKTRPPLIIAYAQSIYEVAKFAEEKKIDIKKQKAIHCGAGMVYDFMRELIEDVFQCPVYNHYGSREVGPIASECSGHDGLHILSEFNYVEVVNSEGKPCKTGEEGEILVTNLQNFSMPLIRYKIGDLGILKEYKKCECGCNYPKIEKITGRTNQNFKTYSGEIISGEFLTLTFNFVKGIEKFQIIQTSIDSIKIRLVVNKDYDVKIEDEIIIKMKKLFGDRIKIEFQYMDEIPLSKTSKHLFTISNI